VARRWLDTGETARVALDDALIGRLPPVCAMTGDRADGYAPMVVPRSLGLAWLLLLAGPLGWLVLAALYPRLRTRYEIRVPMSEPAFDRWMIERRRRLWCSWLGGALLVFAVAIRALGPLALLVALAGLFLLAIAFRAHWRVPWLQPSLSADARGRRVTMRGVHPRFAAAVTATSQPSHR
jgi:hypothetical protein